MDSTAWLFVFLGIAVITAWHYQKQHRDVLMELQEFRKQHRREKGVFEESQYDIATRDGGKSWDAVAETANGAIVTRGAAECLYPGLIEFRRDQEVLLAQLRAELALEQAARQPFVAVNWQRLKLVLQPKTA